MVSSLAATPGEQVQETRNNVLQSETDQPKVTENEKEPAAESEVAEAEANAVITLPVESTTSTHSQCLICKKAAKKGTVKLSKEGRLQIFIHRNLFVPPGVRVCRCHLLSPKSPHLLQISSVHREAVVKTCDAAELLQGLRVAISHHPSGLNFQEPNNMTSQDYYNITGLTGDQFEELYLLCQANLGRECGQGTVYIKHCKIFLYLRIDLC